MCCVDRLKLQPKVGGHEVVDRGQVSQLSEHLPLVCDLHLCSDGKIDLHTRLHDDNKRN
jgi:hypothetical protein